MFRFILLIFFCCVQCLANAQHAEIDSSSNEISKENCIRLLAFYQQFWKADSLAHNGFRNIFGREFLTRCNCLEGEEWSSVSKYFGKPHYIIKNMRLFVYKRDEVWYRYVLCSYNGYKNYSDLGNLYMDIIVVDGKIKLICVIENDG